MASVSIVPDRLLVLTSHHITSQTAFGMAEVSEQETPGLKLFHQLVAVAGMCLCPCTAMVVSGWLLFIKVILQLG